jgi:hypothetical protein
VESANRDEQQTRASSRDAQRTTNDAHASGEGSTRARSDPPTRSQIAEADPDQAIGLSLSGPMPCITCGYDLQGLSVVGLCPECGSAVRATILAKIDPQAEELAPLVTPRLTSYGLAGGVIAGVVATLLMWLPRVVDAIERFLPVEAPGILRGPMPRWLILASLLVAGLCAMTLVRPVRKTTATQAAITLASLPFFLAMCWSVYRIHFEIDPARPSPYLLADVSAQRIGMRFVFTASVILALLCIRPAARRLARRSMAMRAGRLNRQTVLAMCGALMLASFGDVLRLCTLSTPAGLDDALEIAGTLLIFVGSGLFTLGATLCALDAVRVGRVLLRPAPSVRQVVRSAARPASTPAPDRR